MLLDVKGPSRISYSKKVIQDERKLRRHDAFFRSIRSKFQIQLFLSSQLDSKYVCSSFNNIHKNMYSTFNIPAVVDAPPLFLTIQYYFSIFLSKKKHAW